ncbi:MAG TPA: DUF3224 domain-containing protein [Thermoanaerobaculia bacterium]|nr:DUF3224 domain-containing protein [Thermoanaerobaculia bacterium]
MSRPTSLRTLRLWSPLALAGLLGLAVAAHATEPSRNDQPPTPPARGAAIPAQETTMTHEASGKFEVKVTPINADGAAAGAFARHSVVKTLHGDLEGTGEGEMMSVGGADGSGAYVAIETIRGTLHGRTGSFSLAHRGTMRHGADFKMSVVVVPDSGTGELAGIDGSMEIVIVGREHSYKLSYTLPRGK